MRGPALLRTVLLVLAWATTRGVLVWLLLGPQDWVTGDVSYYAGGLAEIAERGPGEVLREYPLPALVVVGAPWLVAEAVGVPEWYGELLIGAAVVTDLAFTLLLAAHRGQGRAGHLPLLAWLAAVPLLGATSFARFDLLPGVLCGTALLLLASRPRAAATLAAVATGVKLWPALVLPPLLAMTRRGAQRRHAVAAVAGTGALLAAATVLLAGPERLLSPLGYQADRGLQVESVAATPAMLGWAADPGAWRIGYAASNSYEITGPWVGTLLDVSSLVTLGYVAAVVVAWAVLWRRRDAVTAEAGLWLVLASVSGFVVTGKVLSPQYLLWLAPIAVAGLVVANSWALRSWTAWLLVAAALTHLVFPMLYVNVVEATALSAPAVAALAARNLVMAALFAAAAVLAARQLWAVSVAARSPARPRARHGATTAPPRPVRPTATAGAQARPAAASPTASRTGPR